MSYRPPTLSIPAQSLNGTKASLKRQYTDVLRTYRNWQEHDAINSTSYSRDLMARYRDRLRSVSYRYQAYKRAIALLTAEEARS